jgi:hypothetical protein
MQFGLVSVHVECVLCRSTPRVSGSLILPLRHVLHQRLLLGPAYSTWRHMLPNKFKNAFGQVVAGISPFHASVLIRYWTVRCCNKCHWLFSCASLCIAKNIFTC